MKFGDLLNNLVGEEGVKTDVNISLSKDTYIGIGMAIFLSVIAVWFVSRLLENIVFSK